jgi:hypothetical protein
VVPLDAVDAVLQSSGLVQVALQDCVSVRIEEVSGGEREIKLEVLT